MKLRHKLPLAFLASLILLLMGALAGIYRLNGTVRTYQVEVMQQAQASQRLADVSAHFSVAIQEWKNVLLRGKDEAERDKYWASHQKNMRNALTELAELEQMPLSGKEKQALRDLHKALSHAEQGYRDAFQAFEAAGRDAAAGDRAARGRDREATKQLSSLREMLEKNADDVASEAQADASFTTWSALATMVLTLLVALAGSVAISRNIAQRLDTALQAAGRVALGDLTEPVRVQGKDEIGDLLGRLDHMQQALVEVVSLVRRGSESVANASHEIAHGNQDLSSRTEQQAGALQQTAGSMTELANQASQSSRYAQQASDQADRASAVATRAGEVVNEVVQAVRGIDESSQRIADIIGVIDGIAFQTNILALNAAVEAARAGEQGRGFAVVASEVRALAGRSAEAAREIKALIHTSVERARHGSAQAAQAGETMAEVVRTVQGVTGRMGDISAAMRQEELAVQQIDTAVRHMDDSTQRNAALVEEMAAAAASLNAQAQELVSAVARFRLPA